jgi:hypothetical protein
MAAINRRRATLLSLTAALTLVWLVVAAMNARSAAASFTNTYCGVLIDEFTWCGDGSNHTYIYNSATYSGGGSVWVCERMLYADTPTPRNGNSCGYNFVERSYGSTTSLWEAEVEHSTGTGARHTITGYAYTA